jgi:hypothetical protein
MHDVKQVVLPGIPKVIAVITLFFIASLPVVSYGGHFTLAFQRKAGAWENNGEDGSCGGGCATRVWVWDEDGNPMPNIKLYTTWAVLMGETDEDGRAQLPCKEDATFDLICDDGSGSTSDIARPITVDFEPCKYHHLYEIGYLYKTDISNPGMFDTELNCTWPQENVYCDEAAYTKSLAYNGIDCTDLMSDQSYWGAWQDPPSYFGQTFVATGDRVVAARVQGTIGDNYLLDWELRIVTFPGLLSVGPSTSVPYRWPFGWEAFWGVDDCPVIPGETYMLQVWRDPGGMNIYHVTQDVYPHGQYYEGTVAKPEWDLNGHICCMTYNPSTGPDFNGDGRVDFRDYCLLAKHWLQDEKSIDIAPPPDKVDYNDLASFTDKWMTATTIPPLPGQASNPDPPNGAIDVNGMSALSWTAGSGAESHDIYIGISSPPPFFRNQASTIFEPGWLGSGIKFYWRIDEVNGWGKTEGPEWTFTTMTVSPPPPPPPPPPP